MEKALEGIQGIEYSRYGMFNLSHFIWIIFFFWWTFFHPFYIGFNDRKSSALVILFRWYINSARIKSIINKKIHFKILKSTHLLPSSSKNVMLLCPTVVIFQFDCSVWSCTMKCLPLILVEWMERCEFNELNAFGVSFIRLAEVVFAPVNFNSLFTIQFETFTGIGNDGNEIGIKIYYDKSTNHL